ncbi:PAS domain-containing protein [Cantharellus anzutake]|uniref:PAS domain-containing protein n=1 Tax=Cantharellus anzutake TaxID=1750568 RepID=UPI00190811C9|nr:PAS domain-containing protein [Cantharellus anzutake]KAF8322764.1 PAS domain-containing protein [Cantharellus anzutake]
MMSSDEQQYQPTKPEPRSPRINNSPLSGDVVQSRQPVYPYIPADRTHPSDAFTGYSEPVPPGSPNVTIHGLYSKTQFDTLSILSRVYTRPNPKIELGPVDDSVSFVVVDATRDDFPVVYCSQNFHRLTGYRREEIVGRNCRFLQYPPPDAPGGQLGHSRHRSPAVEAFKRSLMLGQECQASLVNYRRDGEAFLNLISVVPIRWKENGEQKEYYVGFQVDVPQRGAGSRYP